GAFVRVRTMQVEEEPVRVDEEPVDERTIEGDIGRFCVDAHPRLVAALAHQCGDRHLAEELAHEGDNATLMTVAPLDGRATVLFTRHEFPEEPADQLDASQVLYALDLETGSERSLGEIGHRQDQVEELAVW